MSVGLNETTAFPLLYCMCMSSNPESCLSLTESSSSLAAERPPTDELRLTNYTKEDVRVAGREGVMSLCD